MAKKQKKEQNKTEDQDKSNRPTKVARRDVTNIAMTAGNEKTYSKVILDGNVVEWVAIGWITIGPAEAEDFAKYPEVSD